ncbi:ribosome maturation factor RimP [Clostridium sp. UBA4548]|uniref:ribosome maturation factor RimP n=1 Tax=Clostridium sp. UBA4548 TaxID=1946361 RepID=UPI0025C114E2|nr:ribosome maturation factor RimP [Clostridium sp. UBA4548]
MKNNGLIEKLNKLALPIVESNGFELYYLEYVKEAGQNIFRVYIDSDNGVALDNCVKVSRAISDVLDVEDPISDEYNLEVSSPGVFRTLYTEKHLSRYIDNPVLVNLNSLVDGKKKYDGILKSFDEENIVLSVESSEVVLPRSKVSAVSLNPSL